MRHRTYQFTLSKDKTSEIESLRKNISFEYLSYYIENDTLFGCIRFHNQRPESVVKEILKNVESVTYTSMNDYKNKTRYNIDLKEFTKTRQTKDDIIEMQQKIISDLKSSEEDQIKKFTEICMNVVKSMPPTPQLTVKQKFNLNFFLNEQCKDAINIIDFVKGIHVDMKDFLLYGKLGYSGAISQIFQKEMEKIDFTKRPMHCTDLKRETLYVRNNNQWQNDESKEITDKAIEVLSNRNYLQIRQWKEDNPDYLSSPEKYSYYLALSKELIGGSSDREQESNLKRIIKNIAAFTLVNKDGI